MSSTFEDVNPFPYIFRSSYDFQFDNIKDKIVKHLKEADNYAKSKGLTSLEKGGGVTSALITNVKPRVSEDPPHTWDEFNDFMTDWLPSMGANIWEMFDYDPLVPRAVNGSWINVHGKGAYTDTHHHHGIALAMVCYLKVPENSGRLLIRNPMEIYTHAGPMKKEYIDTELMWRPIEVSTNDVIFFPGYLEHKTEVNNTEDNRYIMSLNVKAYPGGMIS